MAVRTKRGQILRKLGAKSIVSAVMNLQLVACIAETTSIAGGLQLGKARCAVAPFGAGDVSQVALAACRLLPSDGSIRDCSFTPGAVGTVPFQ
jgi:hypothetical protein